MLMIANGVRIKKISQDYLLIISLFSLTGVSAFLYMTWLGYINSSLNPLIYTIFNTEFRKAFKKILHIK